MGWLKEMSEALLAASDGERGALTRASYIEQARDAGDVFLIGAPRAERDVDANEEFVIRNPAGSGYVLEVTRCFPTSAQHYLFRYLSEFDWPTGGTAIGTAQSVLSPQQESVNFDMRRGVGITSGASVSEAMEIVGSDGGGQPAGGVVQDNVLNMQLLPGEVMGYRAVMQSSGGIAWTGDVARMYEHPALE